MLQPDRCESVKTLWENAKSLVMSEIRKYSGYDTCSGMEIYAYERFLDLTEKFDLALTDWWKKRWWEDSSTSSITSQLERYKKDEIKKGILYTQRSRAQLHKDGIPPFKFIKRGLGPFA